MKDFMPVWKDGLAWKVEYSFAQPSAAAVMDPADEAVRKVWDYKAVRVRGGGWRLVVSEAAPLGQERYEVAFSSACEVLKAVQFNHLGEPHQVFNDSEGAEFRADSVSVPLLDWPAWASGRAEGGAWVLRVEKQGYSAFTERFAWRKGRPWWSEAERSYGARRVKARLLQP
ncbi:MAG: hypothetical protein HY926_13560 [Elusimicrobia bacterium]|nr:hypothetical protein [Elusimicrobiota bacterium]